MKSYRKYRDNAGTNLFYFLFISFFYLLFFSVVSKCNYTLLLSILCVFIFVCHCLYQLKKKTLHSQTTQCSPQRPGPISIYCSCLRDWCVLVYVVHVLVVFFSVVLVLYFQSPFEPESFLSSQHITANARCNLFALVSRRTTVYYLWENKVK